MSCAVGLLLGIFTFVELNCENLFDFRQDSLKTDTEFLPASYRHWTPYRYWRKLNRIGQEIVACGEYKGKFSIPDMVALCEVENDSVLFDLTRRSTFRKARYDYVMTSSADSRGMDVALLYSPFTFKLLTHYPIRVIPIREMKPTRDILYAKGLVITGDTLHVFVVHAPSRAGGEKQTRPFRKHFVSRLLQSVDSIRAITPEAKIIISGDFNDTERDESIKMIRARRLYDLSADAMGANGAKGTYRYRGKWQNLDHVFATNAICNEKIEARIGDYRFLLTEDEKYGGLRPFRNYIGFRYQNGYSDHLPLIIRFAQRED